MRKDSGKAKKVKVEKVQRADCKPRRHRASAVGMVGTLHGMVKVPAATVVRVSTARAGGKP